MARSTPFALALTVALPLALSLTLTAALTLLAGCAEQDAMTPDTTPAKVRGALPAAMTATPVAPAAPGHLARGEVEGVLRQGPPWILRRVVPEEVIREGRFVGWRLLSLPDWGLDLKAGDIVMKVNGLSIERPDDLWSAWMQMQSALELRVAYERDGKPRELVLPIDGPSSAGGLAQMDTPPPAPKPSRWSTTVIEGDDTPPPSDPPSE